VTDIPNRLRVALEAEEACELDELVQQQDAEVFQALLDLLLMQPSVDPAYRRNALYALGRWGDPTAVPAIRSILPQLDEPARIAAVDALGRLGTQEALEAVLERTDDPSPQVRKFAALALARINTPEARSRLQEIASRDPRDFVRDIASKALKSVEQ
jgi:HEAT repeat protein